MRAYFPKTTLYKSVRYKPFKHFNITSQDCDKVRGLGGFIVIEATDKLRKVEKPTEAKSSDEDKQNRAKKK